MIPKLTINQLNWLTHLTQRSFEQTQFLFELCDGNFLRLCQLEEKIKNIHSTKCPVNKAEIEAILAIENHNNWFNLFQYSYYHSQLVAKELATKRFV